MSCRKSSLAVVCSMVVAGVLLQSSTVTARTASSEFFSGEIVSHEALTETSFALQPSGTGNYISPLLAESGFAAAPIFDSELQLRFAASAAEDPGAAGWDYLWNAASSIPISAVPEPTTTTLLLTGAFLLGSRRFRKKLN